MQSVLDRIWHSLETPLRSVCVRVFSEGCETAIQRMDVVVVQDPSINAYADSFDFTIGVHEGLMRSAGSEDEVAAVLAHEAAHLLFGHAEKKLSNALGYSVIGGVIGAGIGVALERPETIEDYGKLGMELGSQVGYLAYSPEMELEADQFALYVLKEADRRVSAGADLIIRLHRGDVPAPVKQGEGWASYLSTHPANDFRLAAMRSTIQDILNGSMFPPIVEESRHIRISVTSVPDSGVTRGTVTLPDGSIYNGELRADKFHGEGTYTEPDGTRYVGEFRNSRLHGRGTLISPDGHRFDGEWRNGEQHGSGTYTYANGNRYEGQWRDGKLHGPTTVTYADGRRFDGQYRDDERYRGTLALPSGDRYEGEFRDGGYHGSGTYTYANGNRYEGQWRDGKLHGPTTVTYADGRRFDGQYRDDERYRGTLALPSGDWYEGEFRDGRYHGLGTLIYADGDRYDGEFRNDVFHGRGTYIYANGDRYDGEWRDGRLYHGTHTFPDGRRESVHLSQ